MARRSAAAVTHGLSAAGVPGFARSMIDVDTLAVDAARETVSLRRWTIDEPPRVLKSIGAGTVPELEGVQTAVTLVDVTDPGFSLRNGYLVDRRRRVVYERKVVPAFRRLRIAVEPLERPLRRSGVVASLAQADNYGHWLLLALPLVDLYRKALGSDPDYYYVGRHARPLQAESFRLLGIDPRRIVNEPVRADRLLVAIVDRTQGYETDFLLFADRRVCPASDELAPPDRTLLVTRASASHRRLVNEGEIADALRSAFGVETIRTDGMGLEDEIALFRRARLVVGAHGAGLTNIAFARAGASVVELTSTSYWDSLFAQIAAVKGHSYGLVSGPPVGHRYAVTPSRHDFAVDVDRVVEAVGLALEPSRATN